MTNDTAVQERVHEVLDYNPDTGTLVWRVASGRRARVGKQAGTVTNGYRIICIDFKRYRAHRLAWLWMTGKWPTEVDHINLNRTDNRWCNLREGTHSQNLANTRVRINNACGVKGVCRPRNSKKWIAQLRMAGKVKYLGSFNTIKEASMAYNTAARLHFGAFAREGVI